MFKKWVWKTEYYIALLFFLGAVMLFVPFKFENYFQAGLISSWKERYDKTAYMFNVINAQTNDAILKSFANAQTPEQREKLLLQLVKPYLRLDKFDKFPRGYRPKFLNGKRVTKDNYYKFTDLYFTDNQIVGIKDIHNFNKKDAWFMIMFDVNGILPPNVWGKDIFGVYIFDEGKIEAFGYNKTTDELKKDCSREGLGIDCSYYYKIGGGFND